MLLRLRRLPRTRATRRPCPPGTCTTTTTPWPPTPSTRRPTRATSSTPWCSCCCPWRCSSASLLSSPSSVSNTLYLYFYTSLTSAALRRLLGCENFKLPTPYLLFVISFSCNFRNVFIHDFDLSSLFASIQFPTKMPPL